MKSLQFLKKKKKAGKGIELEHTDRQFLVRNDRDRPKP